MNKFLCSSIFLIVFPVLLFAGNENNNIGGKSAAMGGCSVAFSDFWAINNNQAGISNIKQITAGFYFENKYLTKELSYKALAVAIPTKSGVFGINYSHFGYRMYNEQKVGLAYSKAFGKRFSAGLQFDYLGTFLGENYGNSSNITFEIGVMAKLTDNISLGAHLFNPINTKLNDYNNEKIPSVFKLGINYKFSDVLILAVETEKNINYNPVYKAGIEYKVISNAYTRVGFSSNPDTFTFGFGVNYKQFVFDFSSSVHQSLGYSPQVSLIYTFK